MSIFQAIVLGIVQGLTEFLPISSTAHLRIVPAFLGWEDPGAAFTAVTQLARWPRCSSTSGRTSCGSPGHGSGSLRGPELAAGWTRGLGWYIILGTIPIGIFGLAFKDQIENGARDLYVIGIGPDRARVVLLGAEEVGTRERDLGDIQRRDGFPSASPRRWH